MCKEKGVIYGILYHLSKRYTECLFSNKGESRGYPGAGSIQDVSLQRGGECPIQGGGRLGRCFLRNRALILYCEYGSTSLLAARQLGKEGYEVYTVIGGAKAMQEYFSN